MRDRFEQVRIAREEIAYVVAERLLGKTDAQLAHITAHLRSFTPLYPMLAERLTEFARLFPIHPGYIDTFERVYITEKREVLKTFSAAIRTVLDTPVPTEQTGLISYDHYWHLLRDNSSLRTLPGVADVVEKSMVLEGRITNAYTRKQLQPLNGLVNAANQALRGLQTVALHTSQLLAALQDGGLPCTVDDMRQRFDGYLRILAGAGVARRCQRVCPPLDPVGGGLP